jgi:hypothetical protein
MMKGRSTFIVVFALVCSLLLAGAALAQPGSRSDPATLYAVKPGDASGGQYALSGVGWQVNGTAGGGGYQLLDPLSTNAFPPPSAEVGCCCTYTPCILKNVH